MKIIGKRGSWSAQVVVNGEYYPVVHDVFFDWKNRTYREGQDYPWEGRKPGPLQRWRDHMEHVKRTKTVIVQKDKSKTDPSRVGYIGVFFIENVKTENDVLTFELVGRMK